MVDVTDDEMRAEMRAIAEEVVADYFRQCLAEQDGKFCGLRNHHRIPHNFYLASLDEAT